MDPDDPDITLPWLKLEIAEWYAETLGFDAELKGIYVDLVIYQWVKGPLPVHDMNAMERIQPAVVRRWNELAGLFPDGERPHIAALKRRQKALHLSRVRGGKKRAAQAAKERSQTDNGESDG